MLQGQVIISFDDNNNDDNIGSTIVDINIFDIFSNSITNFEEDIEICFTQSNLDNTDDICLGFFNEETRKWECQDKCLDKEGDSYCGKTDHLTSFSLLLNGFGGNNGCESSNIDYILSWISLGLLIFAIIIIFIAVVLNELKYQYYLHRKRGFLLEIADNS